MVSVSSVSMSHESDTCTAAKKIVMDDGHYYCPQHSLTTIGDLFDELLIEIFIRLPCYETIVTSCMLVSKRWLSLVSHPKFAVEFLNHKKQTKHLVVQQQLPWTFMLTLQMKTAAVNRRYNPTHRLFMSPNFTMNFLPCYPLFEVAATFKDLVLCRGTDAAATATAVSSSVANKQQQYYICNPLTQQWIALPLTPPLPPLDLNHEFDICWVTLLCQEPYYDDNQQRIDYLFRVVVVYPIPDGSRRRPSNPSDASFLTINTIVYCSETSQWRKINLKVPSWDQGRERLSRNLRFHGVVCKRMVCIGQKTDNLYSGMFNPFDITPTSKGTLEAALLQLPFHQKVLECGGRLISIIHLQGSSLVLYNEKQGCCVIPSLPMHELDLNDEININHNVQRPGHRWLDGRKIRCCVDKDRLISEDSSSLLIGMHPHNDQLLYLLLPRENQVVVCDMKSRCLKLLGKLPPNHFKSFHRLELQLWPTPLPPSSHNTESVIDSIQPS